MTASLARFREQVHGGLQVLGKQNKTIRTLQNYVPSLARIGSSSKVKFPCDQISRQLSSDSVTCFSQHLVTVYNVIDLPPMFLQMMLLMHLEIANMDRIDTLHYYFSLFLMSQWVFSFNNSSCCYDLERTAGCIHI